MDDGGGPTVDLTTARGLATKAATAAAHAGRGLLGRAQTSDTQQQTLTIARPVENVLAACRDVGVLSTLLGSAGTVASAAPDRYSWTIADTTVETHLIVQPNRLAFSTDAPTGSRGADATEYLAIEAWPAPRWGGAEVVLRLRVPQLPGPADLAAGGLAFTMVYRLRALLQTGEVPTLGEVPSGRRAGPARGEPADAGDSDRGERD